MNSSEEIFEELKNSIRIFHEFEIDKNFIQQEEFVHNLISFDICIQILRYLDFSNTWIIPRLSPLLIHLNVICY